MTDIRQFERQVAEQSPQVREFLDGVATDLYAKFAGAVVLGASTEFIQLVQTMTARFDADTSPVVDNNLEG